MRKSTFNKRFNLPAGALFYALLVTVLIGAFSTAIITTSYYHKVIRDYDLLEKRLVKNADSGLQLLMSQSGEVESQYLDLYGADEDSVFIKKIHWGLFDIAVSEAFRETLKGRQSFQRIAQLGNKPNAEWEQASLYLRDGYKPLTLAGKTRIRGVVMLPKAGVKGGYVDGHSYIGKQLIYGQRKLSENQLPEIDIKRVYLQWRKLKESNGISLEGLPDSVKVSFSEETMILRDSVIYINEQLIKGNVCLVADSLIYISRNTVVEDILVFAPHIFIEEGFIGSIQAFATYKLEVGRHSKLNYPSSLCLLQRDTAKRTSFMTIGDNVEVEGLILAEDQKKGKPIPMVQFKDSCLVQGQIYVNGKLELRGRINGNVTTSSFLLKTASSAYDNHLMNVEIDNNGRSSNYISPFLNQNKAKPSIVKWLK